MYAQLKVSARLPSSETPSIFEFDNVNLKNKVEELKNEVTKKVNLPQDNYELIYCGCVLDNNATLESYGLKSGVTVHLITKKEPPLNPAPAPISDRNIIRLATFFISLSDNESLHRAFDRFISRDDLSETIIDAIPSVRNDLVTLAMIHDPILMLHFADADLIKRTLKTHPALIQVAQWMAAAVQEEALKNPSSSNSYDGNLVINLDGGDDPEDINADSPQSSDSNQLSNMNSSNPSSNSPMITTAQLAAALTRAGSRLFSPYGSSSSTSRSSTNNIGVITSEMFSQAMRQAFASTQSSSLNSTPITPTTPQSQDMQTQLNLMHEMGLLDDAVNIQALQFTNGDVQAAIEIVFSGMHDN